MSSSSGSDTDSDTEVPEGFNMFGQAAADLVNDSDSDSEPEADGAHDGKRRRVGERAAAAGSVSPAAGPSHSLPSAADLFNSDAKAEFLDSGRGIYEVAETVTFDKRVQAEARKPWLKKSQTVKTAAQREAEAAAQPVPQNSYVAELAAAALMNSKAYADNEDGRAAVKEAVPISELGKKRKGKDKGGRDKSFAAKEKRKRDMGMQSRGKSTVEEEKRLLRQANGQAGFGYD